MGVEEEFVERAFADAAGAGDDDWAGVFGGLVCWRWFLVLCTYFIWVGVGGLFWRGRGRG